MADFDEAFQIILKNEGEYSDHPHDAGGATKYGISLRFLRGCWKDATKEDIKDLSYKDAKKLYHRYFWVPNRYEEIKSQLIVNKIFDMCVNMGGARANKILQASINELLRKNILSVDGIIGAHTLKSIRDLSAQQCNFLISFIKINQAKFYLKLCESKKTNRSFLLGWMRRALL